MSSVNRVILVGRLGQDPKLKATQSGQRVCEMSVATEEQWTDKGSGEKQKRTDWHNIVAWGRTGEVAAEHLTKGRQVYIEGKLQTRSWEKDGQKHYRTEIVADKIVFLADGNRSERSDADDSGAGRGGRSSGRAQRQDRGAQGGSLGTDPGSGYADDPGGYGAGDDDIPF